MSLCPSCGQDVGQHDAGPSEACPHCGAQESDGRESGAQMTQRLPIRALKIVAVVIAIVGLAGLWLVATRSEVPLVPIGQVGATMNMAYVRVAGRCTSTPTYDPEGGYLSFWVEDETGEILVSAYRGETEQIMDQGRMPALGDLIEVAGTLRIRDEDFASLTINVPEALGVTRQEAVYRDIGAIAPEDQFLRVRVQGQVRDVYSPYTGLTLITLRDATGAILVAVSDGLVALSGVPLDVRVGQSVAVTACVTLYRGTPQLVPASVREIVPLDRPVAVAAERATGGLTDGDVGQLVAVRGKVGEVREFAAGVRATVDDGSGAITLLLWQDIYDQLPPSPALAGGAEVHVQGAVRQYKGELELVPEAAVDVRVLAPAPPSEAPTTLPQPTPPASPSPSLTPAEVAAASVVPAATSTPTAMPTLTTTSTPAATPTLAPTTMPAASPSAESPPTATPSAEHSPTAPAPVSALGAVTAARTGEQVTVEGVVVGAASFSRGFKLTLDDGTGRIVLVMWHEVYDDCWDAALFNLGAQLRVTGEVAVYEGELQLQPDWGADVKAIQAADAWAPPREISSLTSADAGQRVMIEGQVLRVQGYSSGVSVSVGDETGEVVVYLWRNILDRVASNTGLGTPGSRVRVVGTVGVYRDNLEVKPALPTEVLVLQIP